VSTEEKHPLETIGVPSKRLARSRLLLGFLVLCLLLLGTKAIHHAMQPKYQGKTVEEWFAAYEWKFRLDCIEPPNRAPDTPFRHFGTNAVIYLWSERNRSEGKLANWLWNVNAGRLNPAAQINDDIRRLQAEICLLQTGDLALPLIPDLVPRVDGQDIDESFYAAQLLGQIHQAPEICVPALLRAIEQTNRIPSRHQMVYVQALKCFGSRAEAALPALLKLHTTAKLQKSTDAFLLAVTLLEIDQGKNLPHYWTSVVDPSDQRKSLMLLWAYADSGEISPESASALLQYSQTVTNEAHAELLRKAARVISSRKPDFTDPVLKP